MTKTHNAREILGIVENWLGWQDETLSDGLKSPCDSIKLWDYAQAHPDLHEMADQWPRRVLRDALGYNPLQVHDDQFKSLYQEFKTVKII
jgi:hypothetical protein